MIQKKTYNPLELPHVYICMEKVFSQLYEKATARFAHRLRRTTILSLARARSLQLEYLVEQKEDIGTSSKCDVEMLQASPMVVVHPGLSAHPSRE